MAKGTWTLLVPLLAIAACADEIDITEQESLSLAQKFEDPAPRLEGDAQLSSSRSPHVAPRSVAPRPGGGAPAPQQTERPAAQTRPQTLQVVCSPTSKVLLASAFEKAFEAWQANTDLVFSLEGDRGCVDQVIAGQRAVAMVGVPISASDRAKGLLSKELGCQIVVPIVHRNNGVSSVFSKQIKDLLEGRIGFWGKLGWQNHQVQAVCMAPDWRDDLPTRMRRFGKDAYRTAVLLRSPAAVIDYVSENPRALGLVTLVHLKRHPGKVRGLQINHAAPTVRNVERGAWPLGSRFQLIYRRSDSKRVAGLLEFVDSADARAVLQQHLTLR